MSESIGESQYRVLLAIIFIAGARRKNPNWMSHPERSECRSPLHSGWQHVSYSVRSATFGSTLVALSAGIALAAAATPNNKVPTAPSINGSCAETPKSKGATNRPVASGGGVDGHAMLSPDEHLHPSPTVILIVVQPPAVGNEAGEGRDRDPDRWRFVDGDTGEVLRRDTDDREFHAVDL